MYLIVFLGNPGKKYSKNRHNIGFMTGDFLSQKYNISSSQKKFSAITGKGRINSTECVFLFPQTYMNNSGQSVKQALSFYNIEINDTIVVHDEIELPFGDIRQKTGGGHKGHNGLRSIIQNCSSPDFHRIRFGVGRPDNPHIEVADYVLSDFSQEELSEMDNYFATVEKLILDIVGNQ